MAAYINVKQVNPAGVGIKPWIPLNRWGRDHYSLIVTVNGVATYDVEATVNKLNQAAHASDQAAGPPGANDVFGIANATGLTANASLAIVDTPLEAIRINQTAGSGSLDFHVMQQGK